eukprot:g52091.t1
MDIIFVTVVTGVVCLLGLLFLLSLRERQYCHPIKSRELNHLLGSLHLTFLLVMAVIVHMLITILPPLVTAPSRCQAACHLGSFLSAALVYSIYVFYHFRLKTVVTLRKQLNLSIPSSSAFWMFVEKILNVFMGLCVMPVTLGLVPIFIDGFVYQFNEQTLCACLMPPSWPL